MEARELRIGNLVNVYLGITDSLHEHKVTSIGEDGIDLDIHGEYYHSDYGIQADIENKHIHGIPLTEEWLLKFGFKKVYDIEINSNRQGWRYEDDEIYFILTDNFCFGIETNDFFTIVSDPLEFVHDLQNLFYDLNKKELEIK